MINSEFTASFPVVRCSETTTGALRWKIRFDTGLAQDITVAFRMDRTNSDAFDYSLLPQFEMQRNLPRSPRWVPVPTWCAEPRAGRPHR
jgi:hypothetical protein